MPLKTDVGNKVWGASLIIAPLLQAISTFFWENGEYGVNGGTILFLASVFWISAFIGLFGLLKDAMPYYANLGLFFGIYGCVGGAVFGFQGLYDAVFNISHPMTLQGFAEYPAQFNLALFWPGPLFPLSLAVLSFFLIRHKAVPLWSGMLLGLAAVAFPLSRIPRIEFIAHLVDVFMLIPTMYIGWKFMKTKNNRQ